MQGPRGPGSPKGDRRRRDPSRVTGGTLRRGDRGERAVMREADDQPSVDVSLRADPIVHYTVMSTVNGHEKGLHEQRHGVRCLEDFAARGRQRSEQKDPRLAADIRAIVEPHTCADPELKSARRYTSLSAAEVRDALIDKGHPKEALPSERTLRDILNRMNYRLKRIQKGKPLKKTKETDAIFADVEQVKKQVRDDPETLGVSVDTKAKVALGDYARGGKNPDEQRR
jgi:hypothetical protein